MDSTPPKEGACVEYPDADGESTIIAPSAGSETNNICEEERKENMKPEFRSLEARKDADRGGPILDRQHKKVLNWLDQVWRQ